jgi:hypothetical protein
LRLPPFDADDFPRLPGIPNDVTLKDFDRWTAGLVRGAWKVIATTAGVSLKVLSGSAPP